MPTIEKTKSITTTARGTFRVFRDRVEVSRHATEREAMQAAIRLVQSESEGRIWYDHDYQVDVELK